VIVAFVELTDDDHLLVLPPLVGEIARDVERDWSCLRRG